MENANKDPKRSHNSLFGLAPIASIEDTTNEGNNHMEATGYNHTCHLHNAKESGSPNLQTQSNSIDRTSALAPLTPRIDISRASSHSSHHDSRDSSPDNVFDQVGTGTLQDEGVLGYREEGTMDLRSSTEELQFLEPEKGITEKEKPQAQPYSPVMYKLEEPQNVSVHHQRKDSTCSEVAAFLCISGRTSRISSVGSQGSANSKLSAASDTYEITRSPSPHRMLLETSFCGPKPSHGTTDGSIPSSIEPSTAKILEQVILSRRNDPTEAVLADGVSMEKPVVINNATKNNKPHENELNRRKSDSNANISFKDERIKIPQTSRSISNKRYIPPTDLDKPIVGVMPSGTEYIRIKLKPDHCYSDNGIADNERILQDDQKKNRSLNSKNSNDKKAASNESPKPKHHFKLSRENGSRSPSPANTVFSRKSSFCSIFKLKDLDSPGGSYVQKKSGSISHEFTERSRSKSGERDLVSLSNTPSRHNSVLAIFKPKRNGTKSKSPSPIDVNQHDILSNVENVSLKCKNEYNTATNPRPHLRYYDTPLDGRSIHIPLHTPPEEKQCKPFLSASPMQPLELEPKIIHEKTSPMKLSNNCIVTIHNRPKPMTPLKCYRIENSDGTITIPLKSPTDEKEHDSLWSMEVQRNNSQDSQETVISVAGRTLPASQKETENAMSLQCQPIMHDVSENETDLSKTANDGCGVIKTDSLPLNMSAKARKQLLFSMKMGSGSQEQMFTTQFSISKTESQSSQLSEVLQTDSSNTFTTEKINVTTSETSHAVYRNKQTCSVVKRNPKERYNRSDSASGDSVDFYRHSRYLENADEILKMQRQCEIEKPKNESKTSVSDESINSQEISRDESKMNMLSKNIYDPSVIDIKSTASNDEQGASTGSEKDFEVDTSKHLQSTMLTIEDHESAGLVLQESFDDELPYIPTTLPEERAVGFKLVPMKERAQIEIKTFPLERPKSTTPIHPSAFENYYNVTHTTDESEGTTIHGEKLKISLPRKHEIDKAPKLRSPRKASTPSSKNWLEFVENNSAQAQTPSAGGEKDKYTSYSCNAEEEPPPLPPRRGLSQQWVDFDSIPEKRKPAKRITSIPQTVDGKVPLTDVVYNYVQPEECQCECHENEREGVKQQQAHEIEDKQPLLHQDLLDDINTSNNGGEHQSTMLDENLDE